MALYTILQVVYKKLMSFYFVLTGNDAQRLWFATAN